MRAVVDAGDLAKAMLYVERAADRDFPDLTRVLLEARPGVLRMVATGFEVPAYYRKRARRLQYAASGASWGEIVAREIPARGIVEGSIAIPARMLRDLGRALRGPVLLEYQAQHAFPWGAEVEAVLVMARLGNFTAHIPATAADSMPAAMRGIDLGDWGLMAPVAGGLGVAA